MKLTKEELDNTTKEDYDFVAKEVNRLRSEAVPLIYRANELATWLESVKIHFKGEDNIPRYEGKDEGK